MKLQSLALACLAFAAAVASADTALETGDADVDNLVDGDMDSLLDTDDELTNQELDREDEDDDSEDRDELPSTLDIDEVPEERALSGEEQERPLLDDDDSEEVLDRWTCVDRNRRCPSMTRYGKYCKWNWYKTNCCRYCNKSKQGGRRRGSCNDLEKAVNSYRRSKRLSTLKCDGNIRKFSENHARDQTDSKRKYRYRRGFNRSKCNGHGWFMRKWKKTCGTCDDKCIFKTRWTWRYGGWTGFAEISHWNPSGKPESSALRGWKKSAGHNRIMKKRNLKRIGCGSYGQFANCNFSYA